MNGEIQSCDEYAVVELFGHGTIAGKVTGQTIGACSFVRVDVDSGNETPGYTSLLGQNAIFRLTIVDEATAKVAAAKYCPHPMVVWSIDRFVDQQRKRLQPEPEDDEYEEERYWSP